MLLLVCEKQSQILREYPEKKYLGGDGIAESEDQGRDGLGGNGGVINIQKC